MRANLEYRSLSTVTYLFPFFICGNARKMSTVAKSNGSSAGTAYRGLSSIIACVFPCATFAGVNGSACVSRVIQLIKFFTQNIKYLVLTLVSIDGVCWKR